MINARISGLSVLVITEAITTSTANAGIGQAPHRPRANDRIDNAAKITGRKAQNRADEQAQCAGNQANLQRRRSTRDQHRPAFGDRRCLYPADIRARVADRAGPKAARPT